MKYPEKRSDIASMLSSWLGLSHSRHIDKGGSSHSSRAEDVNEGSSGHSLRGEDERVD